MILLDEREEGTESGDAMTQPGEREEFGNQLRALREALGLTRKETARRAGITYEGLAKLEAGLVRNPRPDTLEGIAGALGIPASHLYELLRGKGGETSTLTERETLVQRLVHIVPYEELGTMTEFALAVSDLTPLARRDLWKHINLWFKANGIRVSLEQNSIDWLSPPTKGDIPGRPITPEKANTNNHDKGPGWQD